MEKGLPDRATFNLILGFLSRFRDGMSYIDNWTVRFVQIRVRAFHEEGPQLVKTEDQDIAISPSVGSDTTEGVHITTWEDLKLDLGRWYDLNNVSIHAYDCALTLLTTHSTKAVPAENRAKTPLAPALDEVTTTYKGEIIGAFATITHTCPQHHTLFKSHNSPLALYGRFYKCKSSIPLH
ncbi:unnamed protein product [Arctogadus glacialis]